MGKHSVQNMWFYAGLPAFDSGKRGLGLGITGPSRSDMIVFYQEVLTERKVLWWDGFSALGQRGAWIQGQEAMKPKPSFGEALAAWLEKQPLRFPELEKIFDAGITVGEAMDKMNRKKV